MKNLIYILAMLLTVNSFAQKTERQVDNSMRADNYYTPTDTMATVKALRDTAAAIRASSAGVTPTDDILDWSTDKYTLYSGMATDSLFKINNYVLPSTYDVSSNVFNINGRLICGSSNSSYSSGSIYSQSYGGTAVLGNSTTGSGGSFSSASTGSVATLIGFNTSSGSGIRSFSNSGISALIDLYTTNTSDFLQCRINSNIHFKIDYTGKIDYTAGTSSTFVRVPGILKDFLADSTTSGTGETDLYSYTVPANVLSSDGDKIVFNLTITSITASATVTYIRCYFGGDYITIVNGETFTYPNGILNVKIEIIKTGSSSFRMVGIPNSENVTSNMDYANITGVNFAIPNIVKVTGQCATNSIVARFGYIEYKPAATN